MEGASYLAYTSLGLGRNAWLLSKLKVRKNSLVPLWLTPPQFLMSLPSTTALASPFTSYFLPFWDDNQEY